MQEENRTPEDDKKLTFESLQTLFRRWKEGTFQEIIDDWKWIFTYSRRYKKIIIFYTFMGIINVGLSLVSSVISKMLVDIITGKQMDMLWFLILMEVFSLVFSLVIGNALSRFNLKLSLDIGNDIQADIFDQIVDTDWGAINQYSNGDVLNRFTNDVSTVSSNAISWLPNIVIAIANFIGIFCVIMYYDPIMALIAFSSTPVLLLMSKWLVSRQRHYNKKVREMSSDVMGFEVETFYNFDTIKSFGIAPRFSKKLREWQGKFKNVSLEMNWFSIKAGVLSSLLGTAVTGLAFGYCLYRLWTGSITYGTMLMFLNLRSSLSSAFSSCASIVPGFLNSSVSAHRVRELIELPREEHLPDAGRQMRTFAEDGYQIRMRGVNFSYVENNRVLTDSDFVAKPGEIVALVGPSGEGKTTMIRMILGLIHPESGDTVMIDSRGNEVPVNADTRQFFSYVPQGNTLLSGTIAENLRMVQEDATDEQIIDALKIACAWEFVSELDNGINSKIGERGRGVSEGQAQRIAIARAVLRDCPILLLDEATSALDVQTERRVLKNIIQQRPNKTCILTTHRPSVLSMSRRVYRVKNTKVIELSENESSQMVQDW